MRRALFPGALFGFLASVAACGATSSNGDGSGGGSSGGASSATGGGASSATGGKAGGSGAGAGGVGECAGPIPEGARFKVTILAETSVSSKCHVVTPTRISPFELTAGKAQFPDCSVVPAVAPPPLDLDVAFGTCEPSTNEMLGIYCTITYKAGCPGHLLSYVAAPVGTNVNWSAPLIDNVVFRVQDFSPNCFSDQSNCLDEYTAKLERIQ